jgi:hypothetical protein
MFFIINDNNLVLLLTLLTSYQKSLVKLVDCVKSYKVGPVSTVNEVKVAKTVHTWKFGFCRDTSLALEVLGLFNQRSGFFDNICCQIFKRIVGGFNLCDSRSGWLSAVSG